MRSCPTNAGTTSAALPRSATVAPALSGVSSAFTSISAAPARAAAVAIPAAGCTSALVPTTKQTSAAAAASNAAPITAGSSASPNQTTAGRSRASQRGQWGNVSRVLVSRGAPAAVVASRSSCGARHAHREQRVPKSDPWSASTGAGGTWSAAAVSAAARWCSPSTFCVATTADPPAATMPAVQRASA